LRLCQFETDWSAPSRFLVGDPYALERQGVYNDLTVSSDLLHPQTIGKDTWSQIEIDIVPWQILNRRRLRPRYTHDSLKELLFPDLFDPEEKYVRSVRELWKEESRRRGEMGLPEEEGMVPATDERMSRSVPSQGDVGFKGGVWDSTDMWEQKLEQRLQEEETTRKRKWELRGIGRPLPVALDPTGAGVWDKVSAIYAGSYLHRLTPSMNCLRDAVDPNDIPGCRNRLAEGDDQFEATAEGKGRHSSVNLKGERPDTASNALRRRRRRRGRRCHGRR